MHVTWALEVKDARYPKARVMGGYEPTSMGARNSAQVLCKSNVHS